MNPDDIIKLLERLGSLLQPAAKQVWEIYLRQVILEAQVMLIGGIALVMGGAALGYLGSYKNARTKGIDKGDWLSLWFPASLIIALIIAIGLVAIPSAVLQLNNPLYYTIRKLMTLLPGS